MRQPTKWLAVVMAVVLLGLWIGLMTSLSSTSVATAATNAPTAPVAVDVPNPHRLPPDHPNVNEGNGSLPLPATAEDISLPGTQPGGLNPNNNILTPSNCTSCHSNYEQPAAEPYGTWQGSMMSQAARDPLFYAALAIANQDVAGSGTYCIRCHAPKAFLEGRAAPDGSQLTAGDEQGVQCHFCHRMVDPEYEEGVSPPIDAAILAALTDTVPFPSSGMYVVDPDDNRRGPWDLKTEGWYVETCYESPDCENNNPHRGLDDWPLQSDFNTESAFCGTCHDVQNPLMSGSPETGYSLDPLGQPIDDMANAFPVERTYTEWLLSDYGTEQGVLAPQWNAENQYVNSCQDCHMSSVPDASAARRSDDYGLECWLDSQHTQPCPNPVTHDWVPVHDLTGGNTWVPEMVKIHPEFGEDVDPALLDAGIERAQSMLDKAASLTVTRSGSTLNVRITNETGHKLPTGYAEGRQMWVNVKGYDRQCNVIWESGAYDPETAELSRDDQLAWFGIQQGLTEDWATQIGLENGESFHFLLNNSVVMDNRIPPRGFTNAEYDAVGAGVVGATYADDQYWADVAYTLPVGVVRTEIKLNFQISSKEYIEFLRDTNTTNDDGDLLYQLWEETGKAPPAVLATTETGACDAMLYLPLTQR